MATIKDVARRAGVSVSTVSAVLNRSAPVSRRTAEAVGRAIVDTGYVRNAAARSLRSGRSQLIGFVVPDVANPAFAACIREVENVGLAAGYTTMIYSTAQSAEREEHVLSMLQVQRIAGLILIPSKSSAEHGDHLRGRITTPTVLLDMQVEGLACDVIKTENVVTGRIAAEHLIGLGHRRIGYLTGIPGLATSDDRETGVAEGHRRAGLSLAPELIGVGNFDAGDAEAAADRLLALPDPPTAMIAGSNMMSLGLIRAVRRRGLRIPDDLSIVAIDAQDFADVYDPRLTMVTTPIRINARRAAERLLHLIETGPEAESRLTVYMPRFEEGQSTRRIG